MLKADSIELTAASLQSLPTTNNESYIPELYVDSIIITFTTATAAHLNEP